MSNEPRFLPPVGQDWLKLASTDGHSCVIYTVDPRDGQPGTLIPLRFRKDAFAEGCSIVGLDLGVDTQAAPLDKTGLIAEAIAVIMERQDPDELSGDGRPTLKAVKEQVGFGVTKTQFDAAWPVFVESIDDAEV